MRLLGVDLGTVRTGLAVADAEVAVATPLCTVKHSGLGEAVRAVATCVTNEQITDVVLGLPLDLAGHEGEAARRAKQFAKALQRRTGVRIHLWDERLSTASAQRSLRSQGLRASSGRKVVDQVAATLLLQTYLDRERTRTATGGIEDALPNGPEGED